MANYIIQWTDKTLKSSISLYSTVVDESTTSLTLYGKNAPNWGEKTGENMLHLLEHFATNGTPPRAPTDGQLWYDAKQKKLKVRWDEKWNDIGYRRIDGPSVPSANNHPGTLWFDTRNNVLKVRNKAGEWVEVFQHHIGTVTPTPTPQVLPTPAPGVVVGNPTPLTLPTNPMTPSGSINVTADNQIIQDLYIIANGGTSGITINGFNNVVIRNCYIVHDMGAGIDLRSSKFTTIDHVVVDCTGAPNSGSLVESAYNIHAQNCDNLTIGNVEVYDGSSGVFLENCDNAHVYTINGFNFRGPAPRGEFIGMIGCNNPVVEDFYNKQDLNIGWNDSNIYFKNCSNVIVRRGCVDGSNGTEGAGVYLTYDNAIAAGGFIENVDALNMGNGAFAASPAQNVTFRHCRVKDNHTSGVAGRAAPYSGGLVFHGFDGSHDEEIGGNPNNIATNLKIEGCVLYNLANPNTIVFDPKKFSQIDYIIADFTPRTRIYIRNMPRIGSTPAPVGPAPVPSPIWSTPAPNGTTPAPTWTTPTPTWSAPTPTAPAPTSQVPIKPRAPSPTNYPELIFNEDFNSGLPSQVFIDHLWYETSDSRLNYSVENGELLIWPEDNFVNRHINTDGKWAFRYGFVEWEAKLPAGTGVWPAFWLYGHDGDDRPEIDVMEAYSGAGNGWSDGSQHPTDYGATLHKANSNYSYHETPFAKKLSDANITIDLSATYHTYGVRWTSNEIAFFFDGQQIGSHPNDGYWSKTMYLLMSLQFGSISGNPGAGTPLGKNNALRIKYIRAWNLSDGTTLIPNGKWLPASSPTTIPTAPAPTPTIAPTVVPTPTNSSIDPRPYFRNATIGNRISDMTFREEFVGNSLNTTLWSMNVYDKGLVSGGWNVQNSCLNIWPVSGFTWQSVGTSDGTPNNAKFYQKYGYFEASLKLPRGRGVWPGWWLYNSDTGYHPSDTTWLRPEIDIMEAYPGGGVDGWWGTADLRPTNYGSTVWNPNVCDSSNSCQTIAGSKKLSDALTGYTPETGPDLSAKFYTYGALWDSTGIEFFWDGMSIGKVAATNQNIRMFLYLDLWFGSSSGSPNTNETPLGPSNAYSVDYVRCWALTNGTTEVSGSGPRYVPNTGGSPTPTLTTPTPISYPMPGNKHGASQMENDGWITRGQYLINGGTKLELATDGSVVLSHNGAVRWTLNTPTTWPNAQYLMMRQGRLVLLNATDQIVWEAGRAVGYNNNTWEETVVNISNDGILRVGDTGQVYWLQPESNNFHITSWVYPNVAAISGVVTFRVYGSGFKNVELIDGDSYLSFGRFTIMNDGSATGTKAELKLNTALFGDGIYNLRLAAWDVAPGVVAEAQEIMGPSLNYTFINGNTSPQHGTSPSPTVAAPSQTGGGSPSGSGPVGQDASQWVMTFEDHFNGTSLDRTKWNQGIYYDANTPGTWKVENSNLIMCYRDPYKRSNCTIDTDPAGWDIQGPGFQQTYGYFEARIKLPYGDNVFPAFWLFRHDQREFDIMENFGGSGETWVANGKPINAAWTVHKSLTDNGLGTAALHNNWYKTHNANGQMPGSFNYGWLGCQVTDLSADYHIYACEWSPGAIRFFFDGHVILTANGGGNPFTYRMTEFDGYPMYMMLDFWIENGGPGNCPRGFGPHEMRVDYVRAWRRK